MDIKFMIQLLCHQNIINPKTLGVGQAPLESFRPSWEKEKKEKTQKFEKGERKECTQKKPLSSQLGKILYGELHT